MNGDVAPRLHDARGLLDEELIVREELRGVLAVAHVSRAVAVRVETRERRGEHGERLLYTSDAADEKPCVDNGGRRVRTTKKKVKRYLSNSTEQMRRIEHRENVIEDENI